MNDVLFLSLMGLIAAYFGGALVSFFTVVIWRGRRGQNCLGQSRCACGRPLKWYENVPVIGGLMNRARNGSKCCQSKVPGFIIVTESIGMIGMGYAGVAITHALIQDTGALAPTLVPIIVGVAFLMIASFLVYIVDKKADPNPEPMKVVEV